MKNKLWPLAWKTSLPLMWILFSLILCGNALSNPTNSSQDWFSQNPLPQGNILEAVHFVNATTGTAVGWFGTILRTTDGGSTWVVQTSGTTDFLYGVSFTDATTGTAVGTGGTILRTTDGGSSWVSQSSGTTRVLFGVSFADATTGTAVGDVGTILRTTDGGSSWVSQTSGTTVLWGVSFADATTGTAVGDGGTIHQTTNGGSSWVSQTSGTRIGLWGVSFTDATTGTAVGDRGTILRTTANIVPATLQSFQSYWTGSHVEVSWRLIDIGGELTFDVWRRSGLSGSYAQIHNPEIIRKSDEFIFVDRSTEPSTTYSYLVTIIEDGSLVTSFETTTTTPSLQLALRQNHPNPFNPVTRIDYTVDLEGPVQLAIYDISGKLVRTLINRRMRSGSHKAEWDGRDNGGRAVASGIYFYRLTAGKKSLARKAVLLK